MTIVLHHTIVPARDKEAPARFFAQLFGLDYNGVARAPSVPRCWARTPAR